MFSDPADDDSPEAESFDEDDMFGIDPSMIVMSATSDSGEEMEVGEQSDDGRQVDLSSQSDNGYNSDAHDESENVSNMCFIILIFNNKCTAGQDLYGNTCRAECWP